MRVELPETHVIDAARAIQTLDHREMVALAEMYQRWALAEPKLDGDQRTTLIQWAADYERIAEVCGPAWKATEPESPPCPIAFIAQSEVRARGQR